MKHFPGAIAALSFLAGSAAIAQTPPDPKKDHPAMMMMKGPAPSMQMKGNPSMMMKGPSGPAHAEWRKGGHIEQVDWKRGEKVDYHAQHLDKPRRGYEWRKVDGNYILAAAATGLIASVIVASH